MLLLHKEEVGKVKEELKKNTKQFIQMRDSTFGLVITFEGVGGGTEVPCGLRLSLAARPSAPSERWSKTSLTNISLTGGSTGT